MGNTTSNKYCPRSATERTTEPSESQTKGAEISVESPPTESTCSSTPYGCLGKRFIASTRSPPGPSLVTDSLNLLGVADKVPIGSNQKVFCNSTFSSHDWMACRDYIVEAFIKYYDKASVEAECQREKSIISQHLDMFGWVERTYDISGLLRGEIVAPTKFNIEIFIDRPDLHVALTTKLGPFNINDNRDILISSISNAFDITSINSGTGTTGNMPHLVDVSLISDVFINQDTITEMINNGYISRIVGDPLTYFRISVEYLA